MSFVKGLAGCIGGLLLFVIAGVLFGAAQFIVPLLAEIFFWLAILGILIAVGAPVYYWIVAPGYRFYHKRAKA